MFSDLLATLFDHWAWIPLALIALWALYVVGRWLFHGNAVLEAVVDNYIHESVRNDPKHFRRDQVYVSSFSQSLHLLIQLEWRPVTHSRRAWLDLRKKPPLSQPKKPAPAAPLTPTMPLCALNASKHTV